MKELISKTLFIVGFCHFLNPVYSQNGKEYDSIKVELETIFRKDQTFRKLYKEAENILGKESAEMEYFWEIVEAQDKVLENSVVEIIEQYGWLSISQVGRLANTAQWLVMQHASVDSKEIYAPLLKASVLRNESQPIHYARLVDRMRINSNRLQLYGTQIDYEQGDEPVFLEIEDPLLINERRQEIGLGKIQEYAKARGVKWISPK